METGIQLVASKVQNGIRNPWIWNPESTDMESGIHSVESGIQDSLGLPYMWRKNTISESDISAVNFIVSCKWFALETNSLILSSFVSHRQKTLSIYLFQTIASLILLLLVMPFFHFRHENICKSHGPFGSHSQSVRL